MNAALHVLSVSLLAALAAAQVTRSQALTLTLVLSLTLTLTLALTLTLTRTPPQARMPTLVAAVQRMQCASRRVSVAQSVPEVKGTHIRSTHFHSKTRRRGSSDPPSKYGGTHMYRKACWDQAWHPVDGPAPTVIAMRNSGWWVSRSGSAIVRRPLDTADIAALQTFPPEYVFPRSKAAAARLIGNAVPPVLAKLLMQALL